MESCLEGGINIYQMDTGTLGNGSDILIVISAKGNYTEEVIIKR
ncbi:MAG TPA: hypothetical protein VFG54_07345 [Prolixibacteraceae bacterium]|nr:hypothetical protein [Prolixibacteraceae bacterium]